VALLRDARVQLLHGGPVGEHQPARAARLLGARQDRGRERERMRDLDRAVPELPVVGAAERVEHRHRSRLLAHLAEHGAEQRLADAEAPLLGRHRDGADADTGTRSPRTRP
jgi:hypothetical protein